MRWNLSAKWNTPTHKNTVRWCYAVKSISKMEHPLPTKILWGDVMRWNDQKGVLPNQGNSVTRDASVGEANSSLNSGGRMLKTAPQKYPCHAGCPNNPEDEGQTYMQEYFSHSVVTQNPTARWEHKSFQCSSTPSTFLCRLLETCCLLETCFFVAAFCCACRETILLWLKKVEKGKTLNKVHEKNAWNKMRKIYYFYNISHWLAKKTAFRTVTGCIESAFFLDKKSKSFLCFASRSKI